MFRDEFAVTGTEGAIRTSVEQSCDEVKSARVMMHRTSLYTAQTLLHPLPQYERKFSVQLTI
jgi:hypothetical protein